MAYLVLNAKGVSGRYSLQSPQDTARANVTVRIVTTLRQRDSLAHRRWQDVWSILE